MGPNMEQFLLDRVKIQIQEGSGSFDRFDAITTLRSLNKHSHANLVDNKEVFNESLSKFLKSLPQDENKAILRTNFLNLIKEVLEKERGKEVVDKTILIFFIATMEYDE